MKFKRLIALLLAVCCIVPFAACGGGPDPNPGPGPYGIYNVEGPNKTTIQVINFNGGIGSEWLFKAAERFAEKRQTASYAPGKQGIYIDITATMSVGVGSMPSGVYTFYTMEQYEDAVPLTIAQKGHALDVTEIYKDETREGGSLESKLFEQVKGSLGRVEDDGEFHYYGFPHYESYGGLQYNRAIFEEVGAFIAHPDEADYNEYSTKYGTINMVASEEAVKSAGPDGEEGTEDDGMPASMEELIILMDYFKVQTKYAPVVLSGKCLNYDTYFISGLWASLAGADQMKAYMDCKGMVEIVKRDSTGAILWTGEDLFPGISYVKKPQTEWVELKETNGYLGNDMVAKYYAIAMEEIMEKEGFFSADTYIGSRTHYDAQLALVAGKAANMADAAMLIEASYWYNEAEEGGVFTKYQTFTGEDPKDLDVRMFPLPSACYAKDATGKPTTFIDISHCYLTVNGNIKDQPETKAATLDFVSFLYSEDELEYFTIETGEPRAIAYDLTDAQKEAAGGYVRHLWDLRDNATGSNVIYCSGTTDTFRAARGSLKLYLSGTPITRIGYPYGRIRAGKGTEYIFNANRFTASDWEKFM